MANMNHPTITQSSNNLMYMVHVVLSFCGDRQWWCIFRLCWMGDDGCGVGVDARRRRWNLIRRVYEGKLCAENVDTCIIPEQHPFMLSYHFIIQNSTIQSNHMQLVNLGLCLIFDTSVHTAHLAVATTNTNCCLVTTPDSNTLVPIPYKHDRVAPSSQCRCCNRTIGRCTWQWVAVMTYGCRRFRL